MPGTATGDEVSGKTSPLDGRHKVLKPLEPPADASAGRTFPVPLLVPSPKPGSHRRGPPTGKYKSTTEKKAHEPSEYMRQRTKEMQQAGKEADGEAAMKAQFPGGSSGSLTASAAGREAMPGTATGDELARKISPLDWLNKVLKPLETRTDASAGRTFPVPLLVPSPKPGSHRRGPLRGKKKATGHKEADEPNNILKQMVEELHKGNAEPVGEGGLASQPTFRIEPLGHGEVMEQKAGQKAVFPQASRGRLAAPAAGEEEMPDMGTGTGGAASPTTRVLDSQKGPGRGFWIGLIAGLLFLELIFILCCVQIWTCWKRKGDDSAASQDLSNNSGREN
ncbi:uncharacterized protein LOC131088295 isoform X5 [Melospiza georgiana]|uniref:uncharacterized protein LOC131088295 isoform X5 n=1 Tax=Melospiza georgiana TaxID=44398 RepID=UPI0025AC7056|nr:uncharacterized protein LOC131088295 isoform X5 [Melospiza georgiana]